MARYIEIFNEAVCKYPDRPAFVDENETLTFKELNEASGKIYAYLKEKGIGKEDFVQILLPRQVCIPASVIGIMKAGAAFILLEDTYPKDRVDYIYKDCNCKQRIDIKLYEKIMAEYEPVSGNEPTDLHDACFAVYTSGSTGNPKGVLHEYGKCEDAIRAYEKEDHGFEISRCAMFAPFYFVVGIMGILHYTSSGITGYIMPKAATRDFIKCREYIRNNNIEELYLPPSFLRVYKKPEECLKVILTGSEPANGLSFNGHPLLYNCYAMTESGFIVLRTKLDKAYDVAPVGEPILDSLKVCLIDEDGNIVEGAGQGELCFKNRYVRGYINLPEQTAKAFREDGYYHTNDCARRDENGMYYIVGRFDDMIKINGNRVEPVEIETQIKGLTGLVHVVAKGFVEAKRSYICVYYLNKEAADKGLLKDGGLVFDRDALKTLLPDYMLPSYYIGIDEFPLTASGKVYRKALRAPDTCKYRREYVAPTNDIERIICEKMAEALNLDKVSIEDDFFEIGGDSIRVMMFITSCNEAGLNVSTKDLHENRTPRLLALACPDAMDEKERNRIDDEARTKSFIMLSSQLANLYAGGTEEHNVNNITVMDKLNKDVDVKRLARAAQRVLGAHPGMHIRFFKDDVFKQQFEESYKPDVKILDTTEEAINSMSSDPEGYNIYTDRLYTCNILKTEKACYFYLNMNHIISDGTSMNLLLDQIMSAYYDDDYVVPRDHYFYMLYERLKEERIEKRIPEGSKANLIRFDHDGKGDEGAVVHREGIIKKSGSFYVAALAMAIAKYNGQTAVWIKEVSAGRNELYTRNIAGLLAMGIVLDLDIEETTTFEEVLRCVRDQEMEQIAYPANKTLFKPGDIAGIRFNYHKSALANSEYSKIVEPIAYNRFRNNKMKGTFSLNITENVENDTVNLIFVYNTAFYEKDSMEKLMDMFMEIIADNV